MNSALEVGDQLLLGACRSGRTPRRRSGRRGRPTHGTIARSRRSRSSARRRSRVTGAALASVARASRPSSCAQLGRAEHLGVVEEAEHERAEGVPVGDRQLDARPRRRRRARRPRRRRARLTAQPAWPASTSSRGRRPRSSSPSSHGSARRRRGRRRALEGARRRRRRRRRSMRSSRKVRSSPAVVVEAGEVPAAVAEVEALRVDRRARRRGSANVDRCGARRRRRTATARCSLAGQGGHRRRPASAPSAAPPPSFQSASVAARRPRAARPTRPGGGRPARRGQARVAEVVLLAGDAVALRPVGVRRVDGLDARAGCPSAAASSLSRSKARRKAASSVGVAGHPLRGSRRGRAGRSASSRAATRLSSRSSWFTAIAMPTEHGSRRERRRRPPAACEEQRVLGRGRGPWS